MRAQILILFFVALCKAAADDTLELKVRIQPRADFGQFADGDGYGNRLDLYIRRSRLEMLGKPTEGVFYILAVAGDRLGQRGASAGSDLAYAFVDYQIGASSYHLRAGLLKNLLNRVVSAQDVVMSRRLVVQSGTAANRSTRRVDVQVYVTTYIMYAYT